MDIVKLFTEANILVQISICILIGFSVLSWSLIFNRFFLLKIERLKFSKFEDKFWSGIELPHLYQELSNRSIQLSGVERIFCSGFQEFSKLFQIKVNYLPEIVTNRTFQVMRNTMNMELENLENHVPFIGTIGSISPYIGLFGTVLGIIHVFFELGNKVNINQLGNVQVIAPGISEALISTAIGLFVAIPSVIAFNYLTTAINNLDQNYNNFIEEFISILYQQVFDANINKDDQYNEEKTSKVHDSS